MAAEWLAPVTTLGGVLIGWALSFTTQRKQHRLALDQMEKQHALTRRSDAHKRGQENAMIVIEALRTLRVELPKTVWPGNVGEKSAAIAEDISEHALARMHQASVFIPNASIRSQLELAYDILGWPDQVSQWGDTPLYPRQIIQKICDDTLDRLGAYLREDDDRDALSPAMEQLRLAEVQTQKEMEWQHEENEKAHKEWLAQAKKEKLEKSERERLEKADSANEDAGDSMGPA